MNQDAAAKSRRFQSPLARRIGHAIFVAMVIGYLVFITYTFYGRLDPVHGVMRIVVLWCLGALALTLLIRSWRKERQG
jgi:hypothetical protein